jgi:hypothetical protein
MRRIGDVLTPLSASMNFWAFVTALLVMSDMIAFGEI